MDAKQGAAVTAKTAGDTLRRSIIEYFLDIFRMQIKAPRHAPFEFKEIGSDADRRYYQLRINHNNDWKSRRMSIAPLGEASGSKSTCFYVIYDDHLVVKIPPEPITDFSAYIAAIHREQKIANRLSPRVCITPTVSVILSRVFAIEGVSGDQSDEERESAYVRWLQDHPEFQSYLKIDGRFVFFMDLAQYYMLSEVAGSFHGHHDDKVAEEIDGNPELLWELQGFEGRYGKGKSDIAEGIRAVYQQYEQGLHAALTARRVRTTGMQYKFKRWFLAHLAGKTIAADETDLPPEVVSEVDQLIQATLADHAATVAVYRATIRQFVRRTSLSAHKSKIQGVVANILDLLAYLERKGVAMRDFKPDNVLVAGDHAHYPGFLSSPDAFFLGLIDVETAVVIDAESGKALEQPQLGGTPFFSTPSQLVTNRLLDEAFGDTARTMVLQDWYAAVVMIYWVVTGERLFRKTAAVIPTVIRRVETALKQKALTTDVFADASRTFWTAAREEFQRHMAGRAKMLKSLEIEIPKTARQLVKNMLAVVETHQVGSIRWMVARQSFFKATNNRDQLVDASTAQVAALRQRQQTSTAPPPKGLIAFLDALSAEKTRLDEYRQAQREMENEKPSLTAYIVLTAFFSLVMAHMYPEQWRSAPPSA